jgi:hypothetical protein
MDDNDDDDDDDRSRTCVKKIRPASCMLGSCVQSSFEWP